jgi:hypothetical protein
MGVESLIRLPPGVHFGEGKRPGQAKPIRRSEKQKNADLADSPIFKYSISVDNCFNCLGTRKLVILAFLLIATYLQTFLSSNASCKTKIFNSLSFSVKFT